ncbi:MAG: ribose-5-phosphate isomerase RpiA [Beijerinckiaceae bacterium]
MSSEQQKRLAAVKALELVEPGMRLGLGTGSTARHFVELLAERVASGLKIVGVPTSEATRSQAERLGVPLTTLEETTELDLTIDGADEFDPALNLIKGGGAALLREKIVAMASRRMVVIADGSKRVARLGRFPLPVEVNAFGLAVTTRMVRDACGGVHPQLRMKADGSALVTDGGHLILDLTMGEIEHPAALELALWRVPGVVETGLFIGICERVVLAGEDGVAVLERSA